jgi:ribosome maturation factor RimP
LVKQELTLALQETVEQIVSGLGYDTVEIDRSAGGLLRITIDLPWNADQKVQYIQVEDCEKVTRQLQFTLEVEGIEYKRLEVSSPGIDRLIRSQAEFDRFEGEIVDLTFKAPLGANAGGLVAANRKKFRGTLEKSDDSTGWQISWADEPKVKPGQKVSKSKAPPPVQVLKFTWDELREVRLAPIVDFKGRKAS